MRQFAVGVGKRMLTPQQIFEPAMQLSCDDDAHHIAALYVGTHE